MQTRHLVANDLGNDRGNFGIGILVRTAESDETVTAIQVFRLLEGDAEFLADLLGNGVAGNRDRALKQLAVIDKRKSRAVSADIQNHLAGVLPDHVCAAGVVTGCRSDFDVADFSAGFANQLDYAFHLFAADINDHDVDFRRILRNTDDLRIPDSLVHRERRVLFCFKFDDLVDLVFVIRQRGEFDEADQSALSGKRNIHEF